MSLRIVDHREIGRTHPPATQLDFYPPAGGEDLIFSINAITASNVSNGWRMRMRFNDDSGSNYNWCEGLFNGVPTTSQQAPNATSDTSIGIGDIMNSDGPAGYASQLEILVINYSRDDFIKTALAEEVFRTNTVNTGGMQRQFYAGHWRKTPPEKITKVSLYSQGGDLYGIGSTFTLYVRG